MLYITVRRSNSAAKTVLYCS